MPDQLDPNTPTAELRKGPNVRNEFSDQPRVHTADLRLTPEEASNDDE